MSITSPACADPSVVLSVRGLSLRRTNRGVFIMAFQAAYRSFFLSGRTLRRRGDFVTCFCSWSLASSLGGESETKAHCPSHTTVSLCLDTHHGVHARKSLCDTDPLGPVASIDISSELASPFALSTLEESLDTGRQVA